METTSKTKKNNMDPISALIGAGGSLISSIFGNIFGASSQAKENAAAAEWQRHENAIARQHNFALARAQNDMNIAQWNRENQYNSPAAQMQRFKAAGLNPNLIYGQQNTSAQLSGQLSAGAPSSPTDMSKFIDQGRGARTTSMFNRIGDMLMQIPMYSEQVKSMRLDNDLKRQELENRDFEVQFNKFIHGVKLDPLGIDKLLASDDITPAQRKYLQDLRHVMAETDSTLKDVEKKTIENGFASQYFQEQVNKMAADAKISKENAQYLAKSAVYRLNADKFTAELRQLEMEYQKNRNEWMNWDRWINHGIHAAGAVGDILALRNIVGMFRNVKPGALSPNGKGKWVPSKEGENVLEWIGN